MNTDIEYFVSLEKQSTQYYRLREEGTKVPLDGSKQNAQADRVKPMMHAEFLIHIERRVMNVS